MEKYLTLESPKKVREHRSLSPIRTLEPIYLGILGSRNDMNMNDLCEKILHPLLETFERKPEKIILPTEGTSSIYLSDWGEQQGIPCQALISDWKRDGRAARIIRDTRIIKEATHLVCFNGPRSQYYEKLGTRMMKKKTAVYVVYYKDAEIVELAEEE